MDTYTKHSHNALNVKFDVIVSKFTINVAQIVKQHTKQDINDKNIRNIDMMPKWRS